MTVGLLACQQPGQVGTTMVASPDRAQAGYAHNGYLAFVGQNIDPGSAPPPEQSRSTPAQLMAKRVPTSVSGSPTCPGGDGTEHHALRA